MAQTYVEDVFREHSERDGKHNWINKTPDLLLGSAERVNFFPPPAAFTLWAMAETLSRKIYRCLEGPKMSAMPRVDGAIGLKCRFGYPIRSPRAL